MDNHNPFAGHSHGPTPHLITGCPLCDHLKTARNQGITHLTEALQGLAGIRNTDTLPTIRLNLGPIGVTGDDTGRCHSIDLTAKQAEALADAIDSMTAYAASEQPAQAARRAPGRPETIESGEWSDTAVAQNDPDLHQQVTSLFDEIDPWSYLDDVLTSADPEAAAAAYEQIVTGEWDGEL